MSLPLPTLGVDPMHLDRISKAWGLTRRQSTVLDLLCRGLSNKEIAETLGVALPTVVSHVGAILKRSGCNSRTAVVATAMQAPSRAIGGVS